MRRRVRVVYLFFFTFFSIPPFVVFAVEAVPPTAQPKVSRILKTNGQKRFDDTRVCTQYRRRRRRRNTRHGGSKR